MIAITAGLAHHRDGKIKGATMKNMKTTHTPGQTSVLRNALVLLALITIFASVTVTASPAQQQFRGPVDSGRPGHTNRGQRPEHPIMATLDMDHDNALSESELDNAADSLRLLDEDMDGQISQEEIAPRGSRRGNAPDGMSPDDSQRPERPRDHQDPFMKLLDTDSDNVLSRREIDQVAKNLLQLDTDRDGELSAEELETLLRPPRPGPSRNQPERNR